MPGDQAPKPTQVNENQEDLDKIKQAMIAIAASVNLSRKSAPFSEPGYQTAGAAQDALNRLGLDKKVSRKEVVNGIDRAIGTKTIPLYVKEGNKQVYPDYDALLSDNPDWRSVKQLLLKQMKSGE
jgi:hypothetical protein